MLSVRGDAAACTGKGGAASRHVVINDLRKAASAMKLDLGHLDSPAAMFAVYDGRASAGGAAQAEAAAKGLHTKLLPSLTAYRGKWSRDKLRAALIEAISKLAQEINPKDGQVSLAVALLFGQSLTLAASHSGVCLVYDPANPDPIIEYDVVGKAGEPLATQSVDLALHDTQLSIILSVDAVSSGLGRSRLPALMSPHINADRLKAACVAGLSEAQKAGAELPLVAAAVKVSWSKQDADAPSAKRAKTDLTKVRCRHILLRHAASQIPPGERVKKKPTRTQGEAEVEMLNVFMQLKCGKSFTEQCRAVSECDSALRGGDLAGDLGWLDKDPAKNKKIPAVVIRAAFGLATNQLSDLITSERGVHLVLRTA
eukprot:gnl/TRDRNA2_/TRDRNA2_83100_c1_seq1.p1 gnl/TRDRNA2_/TRDRNA2_83100_c1~~gnl/TRDRNA2_/TRDRNA2_83100_c1_seq1.p1  ORF type:complete len:392 (+),score=52.29 gnl/TRDRNA2_/TRDRNA2_83100_c1_seq1:68-1177(+)